jgi:hypothetical protein
MQSNWRLWMVLALLLATACRERPPAPIPGTERIVEGNIRQSRDLLQARADNVILPTETFDALLNRAQDEIDDAIMVLRGGGLHPEAAARLQEARRLMGEASRRRRPADLARQAITELDAARGLIIETS